MILGGSIRKHVKKGGLRGYRVVFRLGTILRSFWGVRSICVRFPGLLYFSLYVTWVVSARVFVCALWSSPVGDGENDRCVRKLVYISGVGGDIYVCRGVWGWVRMWELWYLRVCWDSSYLCVFFSWRISFIGVRSVLVNFAKSKVYNEYRMQPSRPEQALRVPGR